MRSRWIQLFIAFAFLFFIGQFSAYGRAIEQAENEILPIEEGITLAQIREKGKVHTILVTKDFGESIQGVDLSQIVDFFPNEALDMVAHLGEERIQAIVVEQKKSQRVYQQQKLIIPAGMSSSQIAAGTNYSEHGEEAGIDEVFLFPKFSSPSRFDSTIATGKNILLDYEIELCVRFQQAIANMNEFQKAIKGFFLCGDFTDRAELLRGVDVDHVASGKGFTDGKSGEGRFPVGPYIVVPKDWKNFLNNVNLRLDVNGKIRQNTQASKMIKKLDQIVSDTLKEWDDTRWVYQEKSITLLKNGV